MRFRRLNEQSSFLRSVREARRPIDDPIQRLSEPRVWLLTGRCSLRTYTNFDAVFYDWITSRLSAGFQCRYYIYTMHNLFNFALNAGDNSHQAVMDYWNYIYSMLSFIIESIYLPVLSILYLRCIVRSAICIGLLTWIGAFTCVSLWNERAWMVVVETNERLK